MPQPLIRSIRDRDVDLYRDVLGRDDQAVNEKVMISRLDQLMRVNRERALTGAGRAHKSDNGQSFGDNHAPCSSGSCRPPQVGVREPVEWGA